MGENRQVIDLMINDLGDLAYSNKSSIYNLRKNCLKILGMSLGFRL